MDEVYLCRSCSRANIPLEVENVPTLCYCGAASWVIIPGRTQDVDTFRRRVGDLFSRWVVNVTVRGGPERYRIL